MSPEAPATATTPTTAAPRAPATRVVLRSCVWAEGLSDTETRGSTDRDPASSAAAAAAPLRTGVTRIPLRRKGAQPLEPAGSRGREGPTQARGRTPLPAAVTLTVAVAMALADVGYPGQGVGQPPMPRPEPAKVQVSLSKYRQARGAAEERKGELEEFRQVEEVRVPEGAGQELLALHEVPRPPRAPSPHPDGPGGGASRGSSETERAKRAGGGGREGKRGSGARRRGGRSPSAARQARASRVSQ